MRKFGKPGNTLRFIYGTFGPESAGIIEEMIYPEGSCALTKLVGCSFPFKGDLSGQVLSALNFPKDIAWIIGKTLKSKSLLLVLLLKFIFARKSFVKYVSDILRKFFLLVHTPLSNLDFIPAETDYCPSVRELYNKSDKFVEGLNIRGVSKTEIDEFFPKMRNLLLMILHFDTAYRFVAQDVLAEIKVENIKKDIRKEIGRIFDILIDREDPGDQREKWRGVRKKIMLLLKFSKKARAQFTKFFSSLDYSKIKMDKADWYYCLGRYFYRYGNVPFTGRQGEKYRIDKELGHNIPRFREVKDPYPHLEVI